MPEHSVFLNKECPQEDFFLTEPYLLGLCQDLIDLGEGRYPASPTSSHSLPPKYGERKLRSIWEVYSPEVQAY